MKMLDKLLGLVASKMFGSYFKRIQDDLAQIHERLDSLEKRPVSPSFTLNPSVPPFNFPQPVPGQQQQLVGRYPCHICGLTNCYQTHVIC